MGKSLPKLKKNQNLFTFGLTQLKKAITVINKRPKTIKIIM